MESQDEARKRTRALFRAHGMVPQSERVWRDGQDVTAEPPSTWEPPWSWYVAGRRGEAERQYWLQQHAEAVAEAGGLL